MDRLAGQHTGTATIYANANVPQRPINSFDQPTQETMWQALKDQCRNQAPCDVVAIPHNGNIGLGGSYTTDGQSALHLELRAQFEKLVEIHQHKGSSECYPGSLYSDESCNFEIVAHSNSRRPTPKQTRPDRTRKI